MVVAVLMSLTLTAPLMAQPVAHYSNVPNDELYQLKQQPDKQHDVGLDSVWQRPLVNMTPKHPGIDLCEKMVREKTGTPL